MTALTLALSLAARTAAAAEGVVEGGPISYETALTQAVVSLDAAWQSPVTKVIVALLGICFLVAVLLVAAGWRALVRLRRSETRIRARAVSAMDKASIAALGNDLPANESLKEQWEEFRQTLLEINGQFFSTVPIGVFLRDDAVLNGVRLGPLQFSMLGMLPGIATGLGILGTFCGIAIGLGVLSGHSTNTAELALSLGNVISSLSSAFWTSIFGVALSLLISLVGHDLEVRVTAMVDSLREAIDNRFQRLTSENLLLRVFQATQSKGDNGLTLGESSHRQLEVLETIRDDSQESRSQLQTIANDLADQISSGFDASLKNYLAPQLEKLTEIVGKQVTEAADTSTEQARRFTDEMVERVTSGLGDSFGRMSEAVNQVGNRFDTMSHGMQRILEDSARVAEENRQLVTVSAEAVRQAQESVATASAEMADAGALGTAIALAAENLSQIQANVMRSQEDQGEMHRAAQEQIAEVSQFVHAATHSYQESSKNLEGTVSALDDLVRGLSSNVAGLGEVMARAQESMRTAAEKLVSRAQAEEELLGEYSRATSELRAGLSEAGPTLALMQGLRAEVSRERTYLENLLGTVCDLHAKAAETLDSLQSEMNSSSDSLRRAAEGLSEVSSATESWANESTAAVDRFAEGFKSAVQGSLEAYDASLASSVQSLQGAMRTLEDLAEEIAEGADRRAATTG